MEKRQLESIRTLVNAHMPHRPTAHDALLAVARASPAASEQRPAGRIALSPGGGKLLLLTVDRAANDIA